MKLLQTQDYLLLINEKAEIKENTWYENKGVLFLSDCKYNEGNNPNNSNPRVTDFNNSVIAYYPLTKEAKELDLPLLPSFERGINIINKSKQFSLEDVKKAIEMARKTFISDRRPIDRYSTEEIIQSLSTQQLSKKFIPEYEIIRQNQCINKCASYPSKCLCEMTKMLKTITNSEGKQEIQGRYEY